MSRSRLFWIDSDTASDDAVAIVMAARHPSVEIAGISTVCGNVPLLQATKNALYTVQLCEADVPVYAGTNHPLVRELSDATFFHGEDGMGNMGYPAPDREAEPAHAVDALISAARTHAGDLELVTLGPLTNVALAVRRAPELIEQIKMVYVMGGAAATLGNITPAAEYNIWVDPEAAHIVFHSGLPLLMIGAEHSRGEACLMEPDIQRIRDLDTPLGHFAIDINLFAMNANMRWFSEPGIGLADPVAMAVALEPEISIDQGRHYVDVEIASELTRGMTVVDQRGVTGHEPNADVCWAIDVPAWKELLIRLLL